MAARHSPSLFARVEGTVKFGSRKGRKLVDVLPA